MYIPDISQLVIFIRTSQNDFSVAEEKLNLIPYDDTTKDADIFEGVNKIVSDYEGYNKCCIVTDGSQELQ